MRNHTVLSILTCFLVPLAVGCRGETGVAGPSDSGVPGLVTEQTEVQIVPSQQTNTSPGTIELSRPFEELAPWPGEITARVPEIPGEMAVYEVVTGQPLVDLEALKAEFDLHGVAVKDDDFYGARQLVDDDRHLYLFEDGSADLHVIEVLMSIEPMTPMADAELWSRSEELLENLGLLGSGPVEMVREDTGSQEIGIIGEHGMDREPWTTHRSAIWTQRIEGFPAFGPCAVTEIEYGRDRELSSFSHCLRRLEKLGRIVPETPTMALERYLERASRLGAWNHYLADMPPVDGLQITDVILGYHVPEPGAGLMLVVPVYEIRGVFRGRRPDGEVVHTDMIWLEPALTGYDATFIIDTTEE